MNTNTNDSPEESQKNSETTEVNATDFNIQDLTNIVKNQILGGEESTDVKESENMSENNADLETTAYEESEVHSQQSEDNPVSDTDSEETVKTESEDEDDADRGLPKGVKKRIDKLIAKKREAESEVERMKSEMERLSQEAAKPAQNPSSNNPYSSLLEVEQVQKEIEQAKQIRRWCEMNPDGAVIKNSEGQEIEYSADEVRKIKVKALDAMEEHLPAQLNYINNYKQAEQLAHKEYPWWKDRSSTERQIAESFLKHFPEITKFPDYKVVVGDYIRGIKQREQSQRKNASVPKAPSQPRYTSAPANTPRNEAIANSAKRKFVESGGRDDLSAIIASKFL
jgi:hypothetical protein